MRVNTFDLAKLRNSWLYNLGKLQNTLCTHNKYGYATIASSKSWKMISCISRQCNKCMGVAGSGLINENFLYDLRNNGDTFSVYLVSRSQTAFYSLYLDGKKKGLVNALFLPVQIQKKKKRSGYARLPFIP